MDIVRFKGGLGNQMFQYAFVETLRNRCREVRGNLGFYRNHPDLASFTLNKVFKNIYLNEIEDEIFDKIDDRWRKIKKNDKLLKDFKQNITKRFFYVEEKDGTYENEVFLTENCVFVGYWQTEKYFNKIKDVILHDFQFIYGEKKLEKWKNKFLDNTKYVAIHVRRGDYLTDQNLWGNLSESNYYREAILFVISKVPEARLVFFSDDIQWVKQNFKYENAIYIDGNMFDNYESWYDMCLMSCCSHNIIANSSFSWWAAWLNQNNKKIIVAPDKWFFDGRDQKDICPDEWIRLKSI